MTTVVLAVESEAALADLSRYAPGEHEYAGVRLVSKGDPWDCVIDLLALLTDAQLTALKRDRIGAIQRARPRAVADPHEEWPAFDALPASLAGGPPPEAGDQLRETDEDGDEVLDPTPIVTPVEMHRLADDGGPAH